jgi:hypothetical protein
MPAEFHLDRRQSSPPGEPVQTDIAQLKNARLAAAYGAETRGGPFHEFLRVGATRVLFMLLDFVDRSEGNTKIREAVQTTFREGGTEVFREQEINFAVAMTELCLELNRAVLGAAGTCSCPAFVACYEEDLGAVWYVNAGHTVALVRDSTGIVELPTTGLTLGLFSHATCDASTVVLQPGAALVVVSHGLVQAKAADRELGVEGLKSALQETGVPNACEICLSILARVREFTGGAPHAGDGTALVLARSTP